MNSATPLKISFARGTSQHSGGLGVLMWRAWVLLGFAFSGVGCSVVNERPHASWPKPVAASSLKQFAGTFDSKARDGVANDQRKFGSGCLGFFMGKLDAKAEMDGDRVVVECSPDEQLLNLRVLDVDGKIIEVAEMRRGVDFEFARGRILLKAGRVGMQAATYGPLAGATYVRKEVYATGARGLLGCKSGTGFGVIAFIVPFAGSGSEWIYWPRK